MAHVVGLVIAAAVLFAGTVESVSVVLRPTHPPPALTLHLLPRSVFA